MKSKGWYYFFYGQIWLYFWLVIAILVRPSGLVANSGVSYYGIYLGTVVPYSIALLGAAFATWRSASELAEPNWVTRGLKLMSICLVGIVLTPYSFGVIFDRTHTSLGALLFIVQLVVSGRIAFQLDGRVANIVLWLVELGAGIVSALYVFPSHGYLIESQIVFQVAFAAILLSSRPLILRPRSFSGERSRP